MTSTTRLLVLLVVLLLLAPLIAPQPQTTANAQNAPFTVWVSPDVPLEFQAMLAPLVEDDIFQWTGRQAEADLVVSFTGSGGAISSTWLYVPVVPFASLNESITFPIIERFWQGEAAALRYLTDGNEDPTLLLDTETLAALRVLLGDPAPSTPLEVVPSDAIRDLMWERRPLAWSIVAFHRLTPDLKALTLDGHNIFGDDFNAAAYPLRVQVGVNGEEQAVGHALEALFESGSWQSTNRDPNRLTRIVLSGVTAMARATAHKMETEGLTYPAEGIMDFIADADLLHTSNEVPFSERCPPADPFLSTTIFCSDDRYMTLLTHIGLDVVELTGNHVNDYGPGAFRHSLELYEEAGIAAFGGGLTPEEARAAYITEHNGNTIAFIGCNVPGPFKAWVSTEQAGAAPCDETFLTEELPRLAAEVDFLIMTVQQWEFYRYSVGREQVRQFTNFAQLGADVVIGSQAHQPQGFTFVPREGDLPSFLHHGLGNLFFDQMGQITTRQMFLDKLIVYDGWLLSVVLYTGLIEDYCCPRPMTNEERTEFLTIIFEASVWEPFAE